MGRLALEDAGLRRALAERFSREIINNDGSINRSRLAALVFASVEAQRDLTRLTFPTLYRLACAEMTALGRKHRIVVFDAALIFEWGVEADFDVMVAVMASQPLLVKRAAERLGVDEAAAEARLALQLSPAEKAARADYVIVNDGDLKTLQARAREVWHIIAGKGALGRE